MEEKISMQEIIDLKKEHINNTKELVLPQNLSNGQAWVSRLEGIQKGTPRETNSAEIRSGTHRKKDAKVSRTKHNRKQEWDFSSDDDFQ